MDTIKKKTYFVDIDGTIFKYREFDTYLDNPAVVIKSTKQFLQQARDEGHMIILTTARPDTKFMRVQTQFELIQGNIPYDRLIMGIERGPRYLINDLSPKEPGDRAICYNLVRDEGI